MAIGIDQNGGGGTGSSGSGQLIKFDLAGAGFGATRCFFGDGGTGSYTESDTHGLRINIPGTIKKFWYEEIAGTNTTADTTVALRNRLVADISSATLTVANGQSRGASATLNAHIDGTQNLVFAIDAPAGWGGTFRGTILFQPD